MKSVRVQRDLMRARCSRVAPARRYVLASAAGAELDRETCAEASVVISNQDEHALEGKAAPADAA